MKLSNLYLNDRGNIPGRIAKWLERWMDQAATSNTVTVTFKAVYDKAKY